MDASAERVRASGIELKRLRFHGGRLLSNGSGKAGGVPIITLLTDFGTDDEYVGVMKGAILSVHPQATIVDVCHHVSSHDVLQAAYMLRAAYGYFPDGTIHVIVVDPGVGTGRRIIALKHDGHLFVAPDNGVLSPILDSGAVETATVVEDDTYFLKPVSRTFHGRDIFAPVAAHLAKGVPLSRLGVKTDAARLQRLEMAKPSVSPHNEIVGRVVAVDHFGNLITDIHESVLTELTGGPSHKGLCVCIAGDSIRGLSDSYEAKDSGRCLAIVGSRGYLEIAVCRGSAQKTLDVRAGEEVRVAMRSDDRVSASAPFAKRAGQEESRRGKRVE